MTEEKDVGRQLLKQNGTGATAAGRAAAQNTIRRERRRLGLWAAVTIALWVLVAGYCVANVCTFLMFFYPKLAQILVEPIADPKEANSVVQITAYYLLYSNVIWPILLTAAAVLTVVFVLKSRRATLRQIQAGLAEISEQMKAMAPGKP